MKNNAVASSPQLTQDSKSSTPLHLVETHNLPTKQTPEVSQNTPDIQSAWGVTEKFIPVKKCGIRNEILALIANEGGTFLEVNDSKERGGIGKRKISAIPIYPVSILACCDNNHVDPEIFVELEAVPGQTRRIIVSLSSLGSLSNDKEAQAIIGRTGVTCSRELGNGLYEVAMAAWKTGDLPVRTGTAQTGWASSTNHVRPGTPAYVGTFPKTTETVGDFEQWRETIVDLAKDSPIFATILSFAAGSYCRGLPGVTTDHSGLLHLYSADSSIGKSFTQEVVASFQTSPNCAGNAYADSSSTLASTEMLLAANNHGVMCLDELHSLLAKDNKPVERLMFYANGGGRGRVVSRGSGYLLAPGTTWNTTIISSGNCGLESLYTGHPQAEAIRARIIEIDASKTPIFSFSDFLRINKARTVLNANYGHAYSLIVEYIINNPTKVTSLIHEFEEFASYLAGDAMIGTLARRVQSCGLAYAGAHILSEILGVEISTDPIKALFRSEVALNEEDTEKAVEIARDDVLGLIRAYMGTFTISGYLAVDESDTVDGDKDGVVISIDAKQKSKAAWHNNKVTQRTTSNGVIVQKTAMPEALDFTECQVYITTQGKNNLRNYDVVALANQARSQGWLIQNGTSQNQTGTVTMNKAGLGRCYGFDLAKAKRLLEESDRLVNLRPDDVWPTIHFDGGF